MSFKHSEETKKKFRNRQWSNETIKKRADTRRGKPCNRQLTDKWRTALRNAKCIRIEQYSKSGEFIKRWDSIIEAATALNIHPTDISRVCKGQRKPSAGYYWKFYNN